MSESSMSDGQFTKLFATMITLMTCLTLFLVVLAHRNSGDVMAAIKAEKQVVADKIIAERVKPVGELQVGEVAATAVKPEVAAVAKSGDEVYTASCIACHGTGIAGSPKVGDTAAWAERIAAGTDSLYTHAISGFTGKTGMMPPKGGNASLSDDEIKAAVDYMVGQSQ
jgi:cytochrome c5